MGGDKENRPRQGRLKVTWSQGARPLSKCQVRGKKKHISKMMFLHKLCVKQVNFTPAVIYCMFQGQSNASLLYSLKRNLDET